jgi:RimJ/RimL family protein N-acetyltransferase
VGNKQRDRTSKPDSSITAEALMQWAHQVHGVTRFVVTIRPDNAPSQALAAGLGFVRIGSHIDEVDGLEDILEHRLANDDAV